MATNQTGLRPAGRTPVDEALFLQVDPPVLAGSVCDGCALTVFPSAKRCPGCAGVHVARRALPTRGTIWTWTTQSFAPKPPFDAPTAGFEPFAVGYVDLGSVLVESRIVGQVAIGDDVELRLLALGETEFTFAFEKVAP